MERLGLDVGTKNIILARRSAKKIEFRGETNGFFIVKSSDKFAKRMLEQQGVPFVPSSDGTKLIALGERAEDIAYTFGHHLRRPMERGTLSVSEKDAMQIMAVIVRSIIGKLKGDAIMYYCIPADALNEKTNVAYHQKIVQTIIDGYRGDDDVKITSYPINEARALVISRIPDKTGIGVSFGAGMVNVSYCLFGLPVYEFSLVGSGDFIDIESARVTGNLETDDAGTERAKVLVTKTKEKIDLSKGVPVDNLDRAIYLNYGILIERVAKEIVRGFRENEQKARAGKPMPIVCAGGTSSPNGFIEIFSSVFDKEDVPFEIGEITRVPDPLNAVAEGCLIAAELHED